MTVRNYVDPAEQQEANDYWSHHESKKWVVLLTRGPSYRREQREVFVSAKTRSGAISTGRSAINMMNRGWSKHCEATARLATYRDLGCTRVAT